MRLTSDGWIDCVSLETPPVLVSITIAASTVCDEAEVLPWRLHDNQSFEKYGTTLLGTSP